MQHQRSEAPQIPFDDGQAQVQSRRRSQVQPPQQPSDYGYAPPPYSAPPPMGAQPFDLPYQQPQARPQVIQQGDPYPAQQTFYAGDWQYQQYQAAQEQNVQPPLRDAYDPVQEENARHNVRPSAEAEPQPSRLRYVPRILAALLVMFCAILGGQQLKESMDAENALREGNEAFYMETGLDMRSAGVKVDLLPRGQTFEPTPTPVPTPAPATEKPASILAGAPIVAANGEQQEEAAPLRSRLMTYPNNEMHNVEQSISKAHLENKDLIGHLVIEGVLDEVVMQRNNTYYLTRNSEGVVVEGGSVFADESCTIEIPPENLLLRGQGKVEGKAFEPLWQFANSSEFAAQHTAATLVTLYETSNYQLFAVLVVSSDPASPGYFNYGSHPTFDSDEAMMAYVQSLRARSIYSFALDVVPSDRLLTLATVNDGNKLVLVYRQER